ncbi:TetR/AcrR family transcriptional regulator [Hymenobacter sp. DH14]|uniref:TetR/AcrR family transcriptional regulator n=1 Tax=Hymenobacter cyanobacteriorum TaxID=2926463 RepID=A0A9X1VGC9_9BACT|nr:TetR/AcrR family transcriptional regulator [Hymenobacter cyanobacteriorum]MCI1188113.1 TetR/AcrR family transcriptional regulator [Hymenobacter cyanobacteriorum]
MSNVTLPTASLEAAMPVFYSHGLAGASEAALAASLGTTTADLTAQFPSRDLLVHHTMLADIERQKREHVALYAEFPTAVERLYGLLRLGLRDLAQTPPTFYGELQAGFPLTWEAVLEHLNTYSAPQLQQLLNDGIRARLFRSDINIQLVTKIILEQLNMMLNPLTFPPERFSPAEVFRSIFLYYIRGICTDEGARIAAEHFARL